MKQTYKPYITQIFRYAVFLLCLMAPSAFALTPEDVNQDSVVNFLDMQQAINCITGIGTCTGSDVNTDGTINFLDLQAVINYILQPMSDGTPEFYSYPDITEMIDFGSVTVGKSTSQIISLANTGTDDLQVNLVAFGGSSAEDFQIAAPDFPLTIADGSLPQVVTLECSPSTEGTHSATLQLSTNDPAQPPIVAYTLRCKGSAADPSCNLNTFFNIENNRSIGSPGKGYDSDRDRIKPSSCLNGTEVEVGGGSGELTSDQVTSYDELYEKITTTKTRNSGLDITIPFFFGLDLGFKFGKKKTTTFVSELREKTLSQSFVYEYEVRVPNLEFQLDTTTEPLNGLGRYVSGDACRFRSTCGDQFVYQTERGASLYVALTFDFASEDHKETFSKTTGGNFGISLNPSTSTSDSETSSEKKDLASVNTDWTKTFDNITQEIKQHTRLTIRVLQIGGKVSALPTILGTDFDGDDTLALSCSLDEMNPCQEVIEQLAQYASTKEFAEGVETTPAVLNYLYRPYEEVGVFPGLTSELTDAIRQARERLAQEYEEALSDREQASFKLDEYTAMLTKDEKADLIALISLLDGNINALQQAASVCFSDLPACEAEADETIANLQAYDSSLLELPEPITTSDFATVTVGPEPYVENQNCELPPYYVLTGVGAAAQWNGITGLKLEGRKINSNGTLGPREIICDASVQMWVSTPDDGNYVFTGLAAGRDFWKKNNWGNVKYYTVINSLYGWYREFDPVTRQLTGEVHGTGINSNPEAQYLPENHDFESDNTIIRGIGMGLTGGAYANYVRMKVEVGKFE